MPETELARLGEERAAAIERALLAEGVLGDPWLVKLDWLMSSRADATRPWSWYSQAAAGGGRARSMALTGSTSTCRSIRSSIGPDTFPW